MCLRWNDTCTTIIEIIYSILKKNKFIKSKEFKDCNNKKIYHKKIESFFYSNLIFFINKKIKEYIWLNINMKSIDNDKLKNW